MFYLLLTLGVTILIVVTILWMLRRTIYKHKIAKRWIIPLSIFVSIVLLLLPALLNLVFNVKFYSAKEGRVVDVSTGKGVPNVTVISTGTFFGENLVHGSTRATLYRVITHTDADGNYYIPSQWNEVIWWFPPIPGTAPQLKWIVTVFQPGYAIVGDESAWKFNKHGEAATAPRSTWFSPSARWFVTFTRVEPIEIGAVQLTLKQTAVYAQKVSAAGATFIDAPYAPQEIALRKIGNQLFLPQVCAMDAETAMDSTEAGALGLFVRDPEKTNSMLNKLEPEGQQDAYRYPLVHAKNMCEAMKAGG